MNKSSQSERKPPRAAARLALVLPVIAWLSQIIVALYIRGAPAQTNLLAAAVQGLLILGGLFLGIWALLTRGSGGLGVVIPATLGLMLSAGTLLLIGSLMLISLVR
jgi:hypothetical protein